MRTLTWLRDVMRNRAGAVTLPRYLTFIVTFACNARCVMCDSWRKPSHGDLTLDEIERIFRQLPRLDAVRLSGGEPFVRSDLWEIGALAVRLLKPLFLHVTTNGFLTDRIVAFCERRPRDVPLHLLVSLDGMEAKHVAIRGRQSAWSTATATLEALAPRQAELNLKLGVNQTIVDPEGIEQARQLRRFLRPRRIAHHLVLAYAASSTYSVKHEVVSAPTAENPLPTFGRFTDDEIELLLAEMESGLAELPWSARVAKAYYAAGIRHRLLGGTRRPNPSCVALRSHLRLLPNGDVPVCQFNTRRVGNLREQSFEEVWFGPAIAPERTWVKQCPGCWAECEVLPNAIYTGDLLRGVFSRPRRAIADGPDATAPAFPGLRKPTAI